MRNPYRLPLAPPATLTPAEAAAELRLFGGADAPRLRPHEIDRRLDEVRAALLPGGAYDRDTAIALEAARINAHTSAARQWLDHLRAPQVPLYEDYKVGLIGEDIAEHLQRAAGQPPGAEARAEIRAAAQCANRTIARQRLCELERPFAIEPPRNMGVALQQIQQQFAAGKQIITPQLKRRIYIVAHTARLTLAAQKRGATTAHRYGLS